MKALACSIPVFLVLLLIPNGASGAQPGLAGPVIRNVIPNYADGTVAFDLFNGGTEIITAWKVTLRAYADDGSLASTSAESEDHAEKPDEGLAGGATKHYDWKLPKLEDKWPARISVDLDAFVLADDTAYGDADAVHRWSKNRNNTARVVLQMVQLLKNITSSANPRAEIKKELAELPADDQIPVRDREVRYMLNKADQILAGQHPEGITALLDYMQQRLARAEAAAQIKKVKP